MENNLNTMVNLCAIRMADRVRSYRFVLNNWTQEEKQLIMDTPKVTYIVFGEEVGEIEGTPHLQGYVHFESGKTMSAVHKIKGWERTALKTCQKSPLLNRRYCCKGEMPKSLYKSLDDPEKHELYGKNAVIYERGEIPSQGRRLDIEDMHKLIKEKGYEAAIDTNPAILDYAHRSCKYVADRELGKRKRTEMTEGYWLYGKSGVGKTRAAYEQAGDSVYVWPNDVNGWCDDYVQQESVIIDDFRGSIPYGKLLNLVDRYSCTLPRRGRNPIPFVSKKVFVTSPLPPERVYTKLELGDSMDQIYRRFKVAEMKLDGTLVPRTLDDCNKFLNKIDIM